MMSTPLFNDDQRLVWHPFTPFSEVGKVVPVKSARGVYLFTEDGRQILDAISSWWVNLHGHSHPYIADAVARQAYELSHVMFAGFTHEPAVKLAKNLIQFLPPDQEKIFYSDNGSTACEVALKMAFQYWYNQGVKKKKVLALRGAYHGDTFGAMSVGERGPFSQPFFPFLFDVEFVDFPSAASHKKSIDQFQSIASGGEVAAFIYEPLVQGSSGMRMYAPAVLDQYLKLAKDHHIICIADEVMTGFGRTGKYFASEYAQYQPDIMCFSKGLTGGTMALGVTSCSGRIFEAFKENDLMKTFFHGHSFTANPIACAAAIASLDLLSDKNCQKNIQRISLQHQKFSEYICQDPFVKEVRSRGTILALELKINNKESSYFHEARNSLYHFFLERNVLLRPLGNVVYVLPPYVISNEELEIVYSAIEDYLITLRSRTCS